MYSIQVSVEKITVQGVVSGIGITQPFNDACWRRDPSTMFKTKKQFKFVPASVGDDWNHGMGTVCATVGVCVGCVGG